MRVAGSRVEARRDAIAVCGRNTGRAQKLVDFAGGGVDETVSAWRDAVAAASRGKPAC